MLRGCLLWLLVACLAPAQSMRSNHGCEEDLRAARKELQRKSERIAHLEEALQAMREELATFKSRAPSQTEAQRVLKDTKMAVLREAETSLNCCCKRGNCARNELGAEGRAQEVSGEEGPVCCKYTATTWCQNQPAWNMTKYKTACTNVKEQELSDFAAHVGPDTWRGPRMSTEEKAARTVQCGEEITSFYRALEEWADNEETFHGHWIHTVHSKHLAEEISYQLFIEGMPFGVGSGAVRLFTLPQDVKMLWSGTPPIVRDEWKTKENAGELAKETAFGQLVSQEAVGALQHCDFNGLLTFWEAASASLLNIEREKPVLLLLNKTQEEIQQTTFWRAEVPALAQKPPMADLHLVSWKMPCLDLVLLLHQRIQEVVGSNVGSQRRWFQRKSPLTCEEPMGLNPVAASYPPPFLMRDELMDLGLEASDLKTLGFTLSWLRARGFEAKDLKRAGYSAQQVLHSGVPAEEIKQTYSPSEVLTAITNTGSWSLLKPFAYSADELKREGCTAGSLRRLGFRAYFLREAGYSASEVNWGGYAPQDMRTAGYSVEEMQHIGFSTTDLRIIGYSAEEMRKAGYTAEELKSSQYSLAAMREGGYSAEELKHLGYITRDMRIAGYSAKEMKEAGYSAQDMRRAGYDNTTSLVLSGYSVKELRKAGYAAWEIRNGKPWTSATAMRKAGYSAEELWFANYPPDEMRRAGYSLREVARSP